MKKEVILNAWTKGNLDVVVPEHCPPAFRSNVDLTYGIFSAPFLEYAPSRGLLLPHPANTIPPYLFN